MEGDEPAFRTANVLDGYDPYTLSASSQSRHAFWADDIADMVEERRPEGPIVIKGGISPSGVPHLGNMNELMRGYFVAAVLRGRGRTVKQVFTTDDRDPLRRMPRTLADLDGNLVGLDEVDAAALGKNLGKPYTEIPDPFGCCPSYGTHFSTLIQRSADLLEVPIEIVSNTELYRDGAFEPIIRTVLRRRDEARRILAKYQSKVDSDYIPFNPICESCGRVTETVRSVDLQSETIEYECTDTIAGEQTIPGCGHVGNGTLRDGKLPWRFEWPAQWSILAVDFEPFGKDHAEGSWPSGVDIAINLLDTEPPVPMVYEWFTLDGAPLSSSAGNVITVAQILDLVEPEVIKFFFAKNPSKARDFSIERIDQLVADFDVIEAAYFDGAYADDDIQFAERIYPMLVDAIDEKPIRLPYTFAAVLGMSDDLEIRREIAITEGHLSQTVDEAQLSRALARVDLARNWARLTDNEYNYDLKRDHLPDIEIDETIGRALDDLASVIEQTDDPDEIQGEIFEIARRNDIPVRDLFTAGYRLFFDQEQGPKLGHFLAKLDQSFVVDRLRRER